MKCRALCLLLALLILPTLATAEAPPRTGVAVEFNLPTDGPLPRTYCVTLAITDASKPDWILSTFKAGAAYTVTAENKGHFVEQWDGLDENHMPLPPGTYGVKGIYMPATKWKVDDQFHSVIPQYRLRISCFSPSPEQDDKKVWEIGDPVDSPMRDVDLAADGRGVFYWQYLENSFNNVQVDLRKPIGYDQAFAHFGSGGAAGGMCTCTDGDHIWSYSTDGGQRFVYRADGPWGTMAGRYRKNVVVPDGFVAALDAAKFGDQTLVYIAQRGKITSDARDHVGRSIFVEDRAQPINRIDVLDGISAKVLGQIALETPIAIKVLSNDLYALHLVGDQQKVEHVTLNNGVPAGDWTAAFTVPANIKATDMEMDQSGRFYLSDPKANRVYQLDKSGKVTFTYGKLDQQQSGHYDPQSFISPDKLATWRDEQGQDRLVIVENGGPNRVSEWSPDGKLLRTWIPLQTTSNHGYSVDPQDTKSLYIMGHENWLVRFTMDWNTGKYEVSAVYPGITEKPFDAHQAYPRIINTNGHKYLTFSRNPAIYRFDGDKLVLSAGFLTELVDKKPARYVFRDANGDGVSQDEEWKPTPTSPPKGTFRYWGERWFDDLSFCAIAEGTADVWKNTPTGFDEHGNPIFDANSWKKVLTDPVFEARTNNTATALFGANEQDDRFSSSWAMPMQDPTDGTMYVGARGGKSASANYGGQYKISRYDRDEKGNYKIRWRVGKVSLTGIAEPGEVYGCIFLTPPTAGILGVTDQSRAGYLLYTKDGMYVDTILADEKVIGKSKGGMYTNGGEFFAGTHFVDESTGKVYLAMGKETPVVYELQGWTRDQSPVHALADLTKQITILSDQIPPPPAAAIALRGGRAAAMLAAFPPATGIAPALDGSDNGWANVPPITYTPGSDQSVAVQVMYNPDAVYFRWHARTGSEFKPMDMNPVERIFSHGRNGDTMSFYIHGDAGDVEKGKNAVADDARFVFAVVQDGAKVHPVVLGMYKQWIASKGQAKPLTYASPVGSVPFAHVAMLPDAQLGYQIDKDGKGVVIAAKIPRSALPIKGDLAGIKTRVNFDATFAGHNRFWWSNADGSASRETYDEPSEANLYPGSWSQAVFEPITQGLVVPKWSVIGPWGGEDVPSSRTVDKNQLIKTLATKEYPPDRGEIDLKKTYRGPETQLGTKAQSLKWRQEPNEPEQPYVEVGNNGAVHHAVAWIYVPTDTELDCTLIIPRAQNYATVTIGAQKLVVKEKAGETKHRLAFKKGWNQIFYRGYCAGYDLKLGFRIDGPADQLWGVGFSATPPKE